MHNQDHRDLLYKVHCLRLRLHWGKHYDISQSPWPKSDSEWRQTGHGAPWDTNVFMAEWQLKFVHEFISEGLLKT